MASIDTRSIEIGLRRLAGQSQKVLKQSVTVGAEEVAAELRKNTPYFDGKSDRSWRAQRQLDRISGVSQQFPHLKDDVLIGPVDQFGNAPIGFGKDTYWRVHFVENGTINQSPQNFMERTTHETRQSFIVTVEREIRKGLNL